MTDRPMGGTVMDLPLMADLAHRDLVGALAELSTWIEETPLPVTSSALVDSGVLYSAIRCSSAWDALIRIDAADPVKRRACMEGAFTEILRIVVDHVESNYIEYTSPGTLYDAAAQAVSAFERMGYAIQERGEIPQAWWPRRPSVKDS